VSQIVQSWWDMPGDLDVKPSTTLMKAWLIVVGVTIDLD